MQGILGFEKDLNLSFPTIKYWKPMTKRSHYRIKKLKQNEQKTLIT